jgi:pilus assembly protein CpaB
MMSARQMLVVSLLAGLVAAILAYAWFARKEREFAARSFPVPILVARKNIASGTRIDGTLVEIRQVPQAFVQPSALSSPDEATGQISIAPIAMGEQILANKLANMGAALSLAVSPGKRAVTISVDLPAGVAGLLKPGDLVDVVVTEGIDIPRTFMLMQAAPVLAVGRSFSAQPAEERSAFYTQGGPRTVTLEASPYESERLAHLENTGSIKLVLRSPGDRETIPLPAISGRQAGRATTDAGDELIKKR